MLLLARALFGMLERKKERERVGRNGGGREGRKGRKKSSL